MSRFIARVALSALLATLIAALAPAFAQAQEQTAQQAAEAIADTPAAKAADRVTPVAVIHDDLDVTGAALVLRLKEILNESSLFRLTDKDEKKLKLIVSSREEFPGRPGIASAYSVVWIYSASENVLTHYLDSEVGFVAPDGAAAAARALATATDDVASRYAYLFE